MSIVVGPNLNATKVVGPMQEPTIVIDPSNNSRLFVASNYNDTFGIYSAWSIDGGVTWTQGIDFTAPPLAISEGDTIARADTLGNLFVTYLVRGATAVAISGSTNFGQSFVPISSFTAVDQPHLATATLFAAPNDKLVWMCFVVGSGQFIQIAGARYAGPGLPSSLTLVSALSPSTNSGNFGDISISDDGTVMIVYQSLPGANGPSNIYINTINGAIPSSGLTWNFVSDVIVTTTNVGSSWHNPEFPNPPTNPTQAFLPQINRSIDAEAKLAWDRSNGPHRGRVYLSYTDAQATTPFPTGQDAMDIKVMFSDNKGVTWSAPVVVNDVRTSSRFFPRIMVDQKTGNVGISWYDSRNSAPSTTGRTFQCFCTFSKDGGVTWGTNILVTQGGQINGNAQTSNNAGDFSDCTFDNDLFYPIWTDNSLNCPNYTNPTPQTDLNIVTSRIVLCMDGDTLILMGDGSLKKIRDIVRGDCVASSKDPSDTRVHRVSRVMRSCHDADVQTNMCVIEKDAIDKDIPNQRLTITGPHPILFEDARRPAECFQNFVGVKYNKDVEISSLIEPRHNPEIGYPTYDLYDLQFDEEGWYVANGVRVMSRSPWSCYTPLPKELYLDASNYVDASTDDSFHTIPLDRTIL